MCSSTLRPCSTDLKESCLLSWFYTLSTYGGPNKQVWHSTQVGGMAVLQFHSLHMMHYSKLPCMHDDCLCYSSCMLEAVLVSLLHTRMLADAVIKSWMVHAQKIAKSTCKVTVVVKHTFKDKSNRICDPG